MNAPKKQESRKAKTAQTGMMSPLNYVGKQFITPTKDEDDFDGDNVVAVEVSSPTQDEVIVAARQEKLQKALMTAKGRRHKKMRKHSKKTKKSKRKLRK